MLDLLSGENVDQDQQWSNWMVQGPSQRHKVVL